MNLIESIQMAGKTLMLNKLRSGLTMLGIIIGIGEGAQQFVSQQVQELGSNLLFVEPGSPKAQNRPVALPETVRICSSDRISCPHSQTSSSPT